MHCLFTTIHSLSSILPASPRICYEPYIVVSGGAMARKCSFGKASREMTTRTSPYLLPLAHLLRGPQYADWSTIHLQKHVQTLVIFNGISDLVSTVLFKTCKILCCRSHHCNYNRTIWFASIPQFLIIRTGFKCFWIALSLHLPGDHSKVVRSPLIILSRTIPNLMIILSRARVHGLLGLAWTPLLKNAYALDSHLAHRCDEIKRKKHVICAGVLKYPDVAQCV